MAKTILQYRVLEKLGEGGMGVVYKAEDTRLKRTVALKFLPQAALGNPDQKARFLLEAQAAAALDHPNICTLYEIGESKDPDSGELRSFMAMAYVEGQDLKQKAESGRIPMDEILDIARQIAAGLHEAHEKQIVHRDIKSANIMLSKKGQVKVMDFGLAKLPGQSLLTREGTTVGTTGYMSPEQARGENLDHRTDIWSFGVVLYELITGQLPFQGDYEQAILYTIMNEACAPVVQLRPDVDAALAAVVARCLEKDREARYGSFADILRELDPGSTVMSGLTAPVAADPAVPPEKAVVVMPFTDLSPDKDHEYFSDGLTEEIITDLSKVDALRVISRTSAMQLKGTDKDVKAIGRELAVQYVIEGSVRKAGNNLRVSTKLIDAHRDRQIWADKYDGTLDEIFDLQEQVAREIVAALALKLSPEEEDRLAERPITDANAYECYLKARQQAGHMSKDALAKGLQYIQNGLDIVGENPLLYAGQGLVYWHSVNAGIDPEVNLQNAENCTDKIFKLEPDSLHGHRLLGMVSILKGDTEKVLNHLGRALEIDPYDPEALGWLSFTYGLKGKGFAAVPLIDRLLKVDPLTAMNYAIAAFLHLLEGRFNLAVEHYQKLYKMDPQSPLSRWLYAQALSFDSRLDEAGRIVDELARDDPDHLFTQMSRFLQLALKGEKDQARALVTTELEETARGDVQYSWFMADCFALLDDHEQALDWLENAVALGFINYPFFSTFDRFLDNIHKTERFGRIMADVKQKWEALAV